MIASRSHPYHLVDPSPWPFLTAMAAFLVALGAALWAHDYGLWTLAVGGGLLIYALFGWIHDILLEATVGKKHTSAVRRGLRYGILLFILTEAMFFGGLFWGFFDARLFPSLAIGGVWPPASLQPLDPFKLPYFNTLILLLSATSLTWAQISLKEGNQREGERGLALTIALGIFFTVLQGYEFLEAPFRFQDNIYGSHFYLLTGFHGLHVIFGTGFLTLCLWRLRREPFHPSLGVGFEAASWYWHFVDGVWVFLFVFLYCWR